MRRSGTPRQATRTSGWVACSSRASMAPKPFTTVPSSIVTTSLGVEDDRFEHDLVVRLHEPAVDHGGVDPFGHQPARRGEGGCTMVPTASSATSLPARSTSQVPNGTAGIVPAGAGSAGPCRGDSGSQNGPL